MDSNRYWAGFMVEDVSVVKLSYALAAGGVSSNVVFINYPSLTEVRTIGEIYMDAPSFNLPLTLSGSTFQMRDDITFFFYK